MKKDELLISKIKIESKNRGDLLKPSQKSPKNSKKILKNNKKPKTLIKDAINRNKDDSLKRLGINLNSCTINFNNIQNFVYQPETYNANINSNYINHNTEKNTPFLASKINKIYSQKNKNQNQKRTVNMSKNIEDIIRRRILDNKNIKINSLIQKSTNEHKKLNFTNNRAETTKELKKRLSFKKKRKTFNKNDSKIDEINKNNKNENEKSNQTKKYKNKYYETKELLMLDKLEENNLNNSLNKDDDAEESRLFNINNLNLNTEVINDEKIHNNINKNFRSINYDYDSCFEEDIKSKKSHLVKSQTRSKPSKNISQDREDFYSYGTITPNCISNIEDKKNSSSLKDINKINNIHDIKMNKGEEDTKKIENKDYENKLDKIDNSNNTKNNQNDSIVNTNDFSTSPILTSKEKNNFSNYSHPTVKINTQTKTEIENIKKKISKSSKDNNKNKNDEINSIEVKPFNSITERSSANTSSNNNIPNIINSNKKPNIYAPKKINNHFSIKSNNERNNDRAIESPKREKKIEIILLGENENENEHSDKDKNKFSNKITYTKKLSKAYFHKISGSNKNTLERENSYNELKRNNFTNRRNTPILNSSFEGRNNLQMNNIFMSNNYYNNNFNYPYTHDTTGSLINNTENLSSNNHFSLDNHFCNNTNSFCYEINLPKQLMFQMKNYTSNNNTNNNYKSNYIIHVNKEQHPLESINNDFNNNGLEYLSKNINFEDFIILEQKMIDIKNTLSGKNLIINECFEYLNYYYNSSIYNNFEYLFVNNKDINYLKICLGYKILSIIICYNCSLDINVFEQTYLLLKEIINLNYKCIILLFEYIFENIMFNNEDIKNNLWLLRMKNSINNFKIIEQKKTYNEYIQLNNDSQVTILEKMKININFIVNNLNTILNNIKTKNSDYLLTLFKSFNEEFYKNAFFYFFNYILRIINLQGSIIGSTIVQNHLLDSKNLMIPYIKTKNIKKYSLVLDLEETLLHFNINITNNSEGVVNIRPGAIKFLDSISEYYELIVFNEGEQKYTDILIDSLEENKIYFEQRFYRDHVTIDNNDIVKDLIKIGRELDKIIIVDNMPQNFKWQKENGIMIKSFWGENPNDNILSELEIILIKIAKDGGDIRNGLIKYKNEIITKIIIGDKNNI